MSRGGSSGPPTYVFVDASEPTNRPQVSRGLASGWDQGPVTSYQSSSQHSRAERAANRYSYPQQTALDMSADTDRPSNGFTDEYPYPRPHRAEPRFFIPSYLGRSRYATRARHYHEKKQAEEQEQARMQVASGSNVLSTSSSSTNLIKHSARPTRSASMHRGVAQRVVERFPDLQDSDSRFRPLPSRWSDDDKASGLEVLGDGYDVRFNGHLKTPDEAASLRTDHSIPKEVGMYYYEVEIKSKSKEGLVGIGLSRKSTNLNRQPGWEPDSFAYHGDDGCTYPGSANGHVYGPKFATGDVIGCGINFRTSCIFFTKNGVFLGNAFKDVKTDRLYPAVGMRKLGEHIKVNFGQDQFLYDIDTMTKQERVVVRLAVREESTANLHPPDDEKNLIRKLVGQFLAHEGFVETSKAFSQDLRELQTLSPSERGTAPLAHDEADGMHAVHRQKIRMAILGGNIDRALKYTRTYYPRVLEDKQNRDVYFRLRCRKFIEMMRDYSDQQSRASLQSGKSFSNGHHQNEDGMTNTQMELDDQLHREASNGIAIQQQRDGGDMEGSVEILSKERAYADQGDLLNAAIEYGQSLRADFDADPPANVQTELNDIFALMAYPNPRESPVGRLLDTSGRASIAEDLNGAILVSLGKPSSAALEKLCAQTTSFLDLAAAKIGGAAAFVDLQQDMLNVT